ncbi:MAG: hypothetical protein QCI38_06240, partial [Candidatus Thermoplasmatota archaeon]|nr:hypothetical protein [Candidatus Thermoplasmatota archaeon]
PHVWWEAVRQKGFIPFDITVCAYTQKNRYSFSIDLVNNVLYRDFRYGLFTRKREPRSPLDFLYLDNVLSSNTLKELQRRTLIYIFEVSGVTSQEVAHGFKITETMAQNNLYGLVKKGLLASEGSGSAEKYRIDLERLRENKGLVLAR